MAPTIARIIALAAGLVCIVAVNQWNNARLAGMSDKEKAADDDENRDDLQIW